MAWLDVQLAEEDLVRAGKAQPGALDKMKPKLSTANRVALGVWSAFGGAVDAAAVELAGEIYPIFDRAALLDRIAVIRSHVNAPRGR